MKMVKLQASHLAVLVLCLVSAPTPSLAIIEDVLDVIHVAKEVATGVLKAWDIVQQTSFGQSIEFPLMREKQRKVLQRLREVTRQIDDTEAKYAHNVAFATESISNFIAKNTPLMTKMNDITDIINRISSRYKRMLIYEEHKDTLEMSTLITFAEWTVSPNAFSVYHLMDSLHLTMFGQEEKENITVNMLSLLAKNYEVNI